MPGGTYSKFRTAAVGLTPVQILFTSIRDPCSESGVTGGTIRACVFPTNGYWHR